MDVINNISKSIQKAAKATAKKAGDLTDIAKGKINQSRISGEINDLYAEIGALVYRQYKESTDEAPKIAQLCQKLDACNETLLRITTEIEQIKTSSSPASEPASKTEEEAGTATGATTCTACGASLLEDAQFCYKCGQKQA